MAFPVLIAVLGGLAARTLSVGVLKFVATRALLYGLFTLVLPVVIYNVLIRIYREVMEYIGSQVGAVGTEGYLIQLTGMAGWIAEQINLIPAFSLFLSAISLRFVLDMIKR